MNNIDLNNKVAIVTGGAQGFGYSMVERFSASGAKVIIWDKDIKLMKQISLPKQVETMEVDVTSYQSVETATNDAIAKFKSIDILVNNAGITLDNLSIRLSEDNWKKVLDINLTSSFLMSKYAIKKMLKNKYGKIINITSVVGHTGNVGQANYTASKAGIVAMSKSLAIEYAKKNINVNCISPGFITTDMTDKINDDYKEILKSRIPLDRFGSPNDIANAVIFLSSELSDYITGETLHVNGGMYFS